MRWIRNLNCKYTCNRYFPMHSVVSFPYKNYYRKSINKPIIWTILYVLHPLYHLYGLDRLNKLNWIQINTLSGKNKDKKERKKRLVYFCLGSRDNSIRFAWSLYKYKIMGFYKSWFKHLFGLTFKFYCYHNTPFISSSRNVLPLFIEFFENSVRDRVMG